MAKDGILLEDEIAVSAADIAKVARRERDDGYRMARELERSCAWDCDMDIAEALDMFSGVLRGIYDQAEKLWAAENPQTPEFVDGAQVIWRGAPATVAGVCEYRPHTYKVRTSDLESPASYYTVPFEDVSA